MQAEIYALYSTRDGRVRYVGQSGDRTLRFKEHLRSADGWPNCPLDRWFHHEWRHGYEVRYALLDVCDYDKRHGVEQTWIWRFPCRDLLNRLKKGSWWAEVRPPKVTEIDTYMRRHIFNVGGFRGVHYDREVSYYRVLVYNGRGIKWLRGDELPYGSASIWFSDLAQALDARDGEQPHPLMEARRREDIIASGAREQERMRSEGYCDVW